MELMSKPTKRYGATAFIDPYKGKQLSETCEIGYVTHTRRWHLFGYRILINNTYRFCSESKLVLILYGWLTLFVLFSGLILF